MKTSANVTRETSRALGDADPPGAPSRRRVLRLATLGGAAALGGAPWLLPAGTARASRGRPVASAGLDYTDRRTFDLFYDTFQSLPQRIGHSTDLNETLGALAWGQSYIQLGLLRMYLAYRKRRYLDILLDHIDEVLATRDSVRGVTDWTGRSRPAWRAGPSYSAGVVDLVDADGRPSLQVRSVRTPVDTVNTADWSTTPNITVTVSAGTAPGTFALTLRHDVHGFADVFDNLSMDPASPDYAERQFFQRWPTPMLATVKDLRVQPDAGGMPAPGTFQAPAAMEIFAVHTGMITSPIAQTARVIRESSLWHDRPYRQRARRYIEACREAVGVHDAEWRENDAGEGWYVFEPDGPSMWDGTQAPANQFLALARTQLHLGAVTGDPTYIGRARKMARTLKNQLVVDAAGAATWHYWPTWGSVYQGWSKDSSPSTYRLSYCCAQQIEDVSHAHIDVDFAAHAAHDRGVLGRDDVGRLAQTFVRNVATSNDAGLPTVWSNVDGTGVKDSLSFELISAAWLPVARGSQGRGIFDHVVAVYEKTGIQPDQFPSGYIVFGVANLAAYARAGRIPM
jgi:hypothetical protein